MAEISPEQWRTAPSQRRTEAEKRERVRKGTEAVATAQPFPSLSFFRSAMCGRGLETGKNIFATGKLKLTAHRTDRMKFYSRGSGWQTVLSSLVPPAASSRGWFRELSVNSSLVSVDLLFSQK